MRETFSSLIQISKDFCLDAETTATQTGISSTETIIKREINNAVNFIHTKIRNYKTRPVTRTFSTVANRTYYHSRSDILSVVSMTAEVSGQKYPVYPCESQEKWDILQINSTASSDFPKYFFARRDDIGIYPKPQSAYTIRIVFNPIPKSMTASDYLDGTISITQNTQIVTGSSTVFTSSMVGRWLKATNDGEWYRIQSVDSTTKITLETYYEGASVSGSAYVIGESPELPTETHELIPYRVASVYFGTIRRDPQSAQTYSNMFFTGDWNNPSRDMSRVEGGLLDIVARYKERGRADSQFVYMGGAIPTSPFDKWSTTETS